MSAILNFQLLRYWVSFGAFTGGFISGGEKAIEISWEKKEKFKNPTFEKPIQAVYNTSRVAGSAGLGAFIGGITALTAPVSIPAYIYWKSCQNKEKKED